MGAIYSGIAVCLAWMGMESTYTKLAVGTALALCEDKHSYETPLYKVVAAPHPSGVHEYAESYTDLYNHV